MTLIPKAIDIERKTNHLLPYFLQEITQQEIKSSMQ